MGQAAHIENQMLPERRLNPRARLEHLAYIHIEPDGGAIVLDASDGGIGFHSVIPFHQMEKISFHFSLHTPQRLHVSGEIAWVDKTLKNGGLKFNDLSPEIIRGIRTRLSATPPLSKNIHRLQSAIGDDSVGQETRSHGPSSPPFSSKVTQSSSSVRNIAALFGRLENLEKGFDALLDRVRKCEDQLPRQGRRRTDLR
jgi:hypothetical protein